MVCFYTLPEDSCRQVHPCILLFFGLYCSERTNLIEHPKIGFERMEPACLNLTSVNWRDLDPENPVRSAYSTIYICKLHSNNDSVDELSVDKERCKQTACFPSGLQLIFIHTHSSRVCSDGIICCKTTTRQAHLSPKLVNVGSIVCESTFRRLHVD